MEKFINFSPYIYALDNTLNLIDLRGLSPSDIYLKGDDKEGALKKLQETFPNLEITMDENGKLASNGEAKTQEDLLLQNAIENPHIKVNLWTTNENYVTNSKGDVNYFVVGLYGGNRINSNRKIITNQYFNMEHAVVWENAGGSSIGRSLLHEMLESYIGGFFYPNTNYESSFESAHKRTVSMENIPQYYPPKVYDQSTGTVYLLDVNGKYWPVYQK